MASLIIPESFTICVKTLFININIFTVSYADIQVFKAVLNIRYDKTCDINFFTRLHIATPMVITMPDANTGRRGYFNDITGDLNYEDFF